MTEIEKLHVELGLLRELCEEYRKTITGLETRVADLRITVKRLDHLNRYNDRHQNTTERSR